MIYISVVTYNTSRSDLEKLIGSCKIIRQSFQLIIIDNSRSNALEEFFKIYKFVKYIHNPENPGFGAAHNIALELAILNNVEYHFVVNPDAYFIEDVISPMLAYMESHKDVGMMMPKILNLDNTVQNLPKLLPNPLSIFRRKFKRPSILYKNFINRYELRFVPDHIIYEAPILSGCFTLFRVNALKQIGLYDDRFFMYFEDWDISRRMNQIYKTIYFPQVDVYHGYESGANKSKHLFKIFVKSYILYFNKWGWAFDFTRKKVNMKTLSQFK